MCQSGFGGCVLNCGLLAYVDKKTGQVVKVEGDPSDPVSQGKICTDRVPNIPKVIYHKAQLLYPLKRVGERGENKWERISWDKAMDEVAAKLKGLVQKYGPETIATIEGTYRSDVYWTRTRFLNLIGNPANVLDAGTICGQVTTSLHHCMFGDPGRSHDIVNANCVVTARDFNASFPAMWWWLEKRIKDGRKGLKPPLKLIITDDRCTDIVRYADHWLQLRPGTDGALFMCWLNIIINENLFDEKFVREWTNAAFLIRSDTNKLLRYPEVGVDAEGEDFVVWDEKNKSPGRYNCERQEYKASKPALTGTYEIKLLNGKTVKCRTIWQALTDRVAPYTPEKTETITWVPAQQIKETARTYATTKPAVIQWCVASDQIGKNAVRVEIAKTILRMITGNIDVLGGEPLYGPGPIIGGKMFIRDSMLELSDKLPPSQYSKMIGADKYKMMSLERWALTEGNYKRVFGIPENMSGHRVQANPPAGWRQILSGKPYPVRALITWSANPMVSLANTKLVYRALKDVDLHVVCEHVMTPTAQLADYVLPIATKMERCWMGTYQDCASDVAVAEAAIKPLGERRSDYQFWRELALRFGFEEYFPWKTDEEVADYRLKPIGLTLKEAAKKGLVYSEFGATGLVPGTAKNEKGGYTGRLYEKVDSRTGKPRGFATQTGKAELYSIVLEQLGYDPLPSYEEPAESPLSTPALATRYPLILTTGGRHRPQFHSEYRQWGMGMREQHPDPIVDINTDTARNLEIANGQWVWIETRKGRIVMKARVSHAIHPKVVNAQASWWYPELPGEEPWLHGAWISNVNVLTDDDPATLDPYAGAWGCRALLCKVYKAAPEEIPSFLH